jgi:hypothetical protein
MYHVHDLLAEIVTAMEAYEESEGHTYEVDPVDDGSAWVTVTAPSGEVTRFGLILNESEEGHYLNADAIKRRDLNHP